MTKSNSGSTWRTPHLGHKASSKVLRRLIDVTPAELAGARLVLALHFLGASLLLHSAADP